MNEMKKPIAPCPPVISQAADKIFYACGICGELLVTIISAKEPFASGDIPRLCSKCKTEVKWK